MNSNGKTLKIDEESFAPDTKAQMQSIRINAHVFDNLASILGLTRNDKDGKWQRGSSDAVSKFVGKITEKLINAGQVDLSLISDVPATVPATVIQDKPSTKAKA